MAKGAEKPALPEIGTLPAIAKKRKVPGRPFTGKNDPRRNNTTPGPGRPTDEFRARYRALESREEGLAFLEAILTGKSGPVTEETITETGPNGEQQVKVVRTIEVDGDLYLKAREHVVKHCHPGLVQQVDVTSGGEKLTQAVTIFGGLTVEF